MQAIFADIVLTNKIIGGRILANYRLQSINHISGKKLIPGKLLYQLGVLTGIRRYKNIWHNTTSAKNFAALSCMISRSPQKSAIV
jgi:hypothetical protein